MDPQTQEAPYKNNLLQPSYGAVPWGEYDNQGTRQSHSPFRTRTHLHTHILHGLTPTLQAASITALLKPAATATACTPLKPTIGLRNSWFFLFFF